MTTKLVLAVAVFGFSASAFNDSSSTLDVFHTARVPIMGLQIDPVTAKDTEEAFQEALKEELPGLQEVNLLASPQTHGKFVQPHLQMRAGGKTLGSPGNDGVSAFEKDVTDLVLGLSKGGGAATPFGGSVEKINDLIKNDMMPKVKAAHEANQNDLDKLAHELKTCTSTKDNVLEKAGKSKVIYKDSSKGHKSCRATEAGLYTETLETWKDLKAKKKIKEEVCKAYSETSKKVGEQNSNRAIVSKGSSESVEVYVKRITRTICGNPGGKGNGGAGHGGLLDELMNAKDDCEKKTKEYNDQNTNFKKLDKQWHETRKKCDNIQDVMDNGACKFAVDSKDACETYEECFKDKKEAFDTTEAAVRQEEIDRKAEWKGLNRMSCLIAAFADGKVEDAEVTACKEAVHSTDHFDIKYPMIQDMDKCLVPDLYPTTAAYKQAEFTPLPALAKGKVDANQCNAVTEISTEPNTGSPTSCKCERVTLNGPYQPGAMVKCQNCIDIRRSNDKNSCPVGTKLFSPQRRSDWETFIKSADPLRAPNWIIDVTRPQNGCGGCTRHAMNSAVSEQKTWTTKDGSPWWLRSTRYNEPNGDYHANCYLDLWHNPQNADSVTWNDGSCSYHSKSYYCQSVQLTLKPKAGSPSGCVCKKVEIAAGHVYSAGVLMKCTKCLTVHKSNDKNSCPDGTKIFSPATREDWKAFIASATPLRDPHWIIDVTRPQNGCGGCTRHAMNSKNAAQATWRTSDGSPWWLRSTRYNEPNGDYTANCYLDLWHTPANENSVTWNDGSCHYRSKSYYCQTVKSKKKKEVTTTAPPWKVSISTKPKEGSPDSCKCEKLELKGEYAAGALLKCTNCFDVKKKTDRNSCPEGTKIFSPQSRDDWKTFFASGGKPLYAPNWIIDVTRPQNGCGGCTGNAMNSGNVKQSSWQTSDGSPWWFRSNTYSEPNGDYTANCYLDLWRNPSSEDNIMWNDGSCGYHSKSYYCQPKSE